MSPFLHHFKLILPALTLAMNFALPSAYSQENAEFREFTSSEGKTIEAKPISLSGDTIKIEMKNGRAFELPVLRLSPEDQQWIGEWAKEKANEFVPELKISFDENLDQSNDETGFVYIEKFSPELEITNEETEFDLTDAKATILLIVENMEEDDVFVVLSKETFPLSVAAGETTKLEGKNAETKYATIRAYGGKYVGHTVIIENASGKVIANDGTRAWGKNPEGAQKAAEGSTVKAGFESP